MGSTLATLRSNVRLHLQEETAREWSDAQINRYVGRAYQWFAAWLSQLKESDWFQHAEDITLAANATDVDLTTLSKTFAAVKYMEYASSGGFYTRLSPMQEGDEYRLRHSTTFVVSGDSAPRYRVRQPSTLFFLPKSSAARTMSLTYRWRPAQPSSDSDTVDTPDEYDDVIEYRATVLALADEGEKDQQFEGLLAERLVEVASLESNTNAEGLTRTVRNVSTRQLF